MFIVSFSYKPYYNIVNDMCVYFGSVGICVFHHDIALIAGTVSTQQTSMCMCVRESNQIRERSESMTALEITFL